MVPNFSQLLEDKTLQATISPRVNPEHIPIAISGARASNEREYDVKTMKGRFDGLREVRV